MQDSTPPPDLCNASTRLCKESHSKHIFGPGWDISSLRRPSATNSAPPAVPVPAGATLTTGAAASTAVAVLGGHVTSQPPAPERPAAPPSRSLYPQARGTLRPKPCTARRSCPRRRHPDHRRLGAAHAATCAPSTATATTWASSWWQACGVALA